MSGPLRISTAFDGSAFWIWKKLPAGAEKGRYGLIEQAKGGILCLNGVQKLSPKVQELLATLIEKNTFCRMGESAVVREGETTIIATTTEPADSPSIERFVRNMPMLIALPDLSDRGPQGNFRASGSLYQPGIPLHKAAVLYSP